MTEEVLYLLGAGASVDAVPLAADIARRLYGFAEQTTRVWPIGPDGATLQDSSDPFWGILKEKFRTDVRWLANEAGSHASVDTYAKKLYLKNDMANLKKLKAVLSCYLIIEQGLNRLDNRYDSFFASVLDWSSSRELMIPKNIHILSWNYDTQLEKAFYGFCDSSDLVYRQVTSNPGIHRLNGYCGTFPAGHWGPAFSSVWDSDSLQVWKNGIQLYTEYMAQTNAPDADIRFAWETETQILLSRMAGTFKAATSLVVIGYSFPFFNRDIDKKILTSLLNIKKVYLQFPQGEHASIAERIASMTPDLPKAKPIENIKLFFIPPDFSSQKDSP